MLERYILLFSLLFSIILLSWTANFAQDQTQTRAIHYQIKPIPSADRTNLEISVRFKADNISSIKLPQDCFGTPDISRFVKDFSGEVGTVVGPGSNKAERSVKANKSGEVSLKYVLSFDPLDMDENPYAPHTSGRHFNVAGCQYMLSIGDENQKHPFKIEIVDAPQNWRLYSTIDKNASSFEGIASYEELASSVIGGGAESHVFTANEKPVVVSIHGTFDLRNREIYSAAEQIIKLQRAIFNDHNYPFFQIVIASRKGFVSGYAPANSFICFIKPEITKDELSVLLAHELMHNWLPNKIKIVRDKRFSSIRDEWFSEGFTDYLARKLLLDNHLMTPEKFAELINQDIINIADNPYRAATYEDLATAAKAGKYSTAYKKLAYYRGALMALNWETRLRQNGRKENLIDLIRDLFWLAAKTDGKIEEAIFFGFAQGYGLDAEKDLEKFIIRGEPIEVASDALGEKYELHETDVPSFEPGFLLNETFQTRKITGVDVDGAAYRAGLREGMEYISIENSNRFGNGWSAKKPLIVKAKADGTTHRFEFFPLGPSMKVKLFRRRG